MWSLCGSGALSNYNGDPRQHHLLYSDVFTSVYKHCSLMRCDVAMREEHIASTIITYSTRVLQGTSIETVSIVLQYLYPP
jgi:hypothetical protein